MASKRKPKAPSLTIQLQRRIGAWSEKNPAVSVTKVASSFNVTVAQARYAIEQYRLGALGTKPTKPKQADVSAVVENRTEIEIMEQTAKLLLASLSVDKNLTINDRVKMLSDLSSVIKTTHNLSLTNHIRKADALVIASIIRRFKPDASDNDIIRIYAEEVEKCKLH